MAELHQPLDVRTNMNQPFMFLGPDGSQMQGWLVDGTQDLSTLGATPGSVMFDVRNGAIHRTDENGDVSSDRPLWEVVANTAIQGSTWNIDASLSTKYQVTGSLSGAVTVATPTKWNNGQKIFLDFLASQTVQVNFPAANGFFKRQGEARPDHTSRTVYILEKMNTGILVCASNVEASDWQ